MRIRSGMIITPQDVLYLVIAFCVIWVTVFVCWTFYYLMRILRTTNQIVDEFRTRLQTLLETINYVRGKVDHMSSLMTLATGGVTELLKKVVTKKAKQWVDDGTDDINEAAKEAVDRAVAATAKKIKKTTSKLRK